MLHYYFQEVCSQIWATLYDYPCLKSCDGIVRYVKECVRVAWGLVNQVSRSNGPSPPQFVPLSQTEL